MKFSKVKLQQIVEKKYNYNSKAIKKTIDIVNLINKYEEMDKSTQEVMILICLNSKNVIISYTEIARGGISWCNVDIKNIFQTVLLCNASKFILVHNHPSGVAKISNKDRVITEKVKEASRLMNIELLDHIIIGNDDYKSCLYE